MTFATRFDEAEWKRLCFAVLDTYWLAASIDGRIDALEEAALADALANPQLVESALMAEVLRSMAPRFGELVAQYEPRIDGPTGHEEALRSVGALLDARVDAATAEGFKSALVDLGLVVANASGTPHAGRGRLSDAELAVIAAVAEWLGVDDA